MFQHISRLSNRRVWSIEFLKFGHLKILSGNRSTGSPACRLKIGEDAAKQKVSFRFLCSQTRPDSESTAKLSVRPAGDFGELIERVSNCEDVKTLLNIIEPYLSVGQQSPCELGVEQLTAICNRLNELHSMPRAKSEEWRSLKEHYDFLDRYSSALKEFNEITSSSASMRLLLGRANQLINPETDKRFLLALLDLLCRTKENPTSRIVEVTLQELSRRREDLNSAELLDSLRMMSHYLNHPLATDDLFKFNLKLLKVAKRRILGDELDPADIDMTIGFLAIFLRTENRFDFAVSEFLIDRLLSPSLRPSISFENYVYVSRKIARSDILGHLADNRHVRIRKDKMRLVYQVNGVRSPSNRSLGGCVLALIARCNEEIYKELSEQPTDKKFDWFFVNFHIANKSNFWNEFTTAYDEKFLRLIASYLRQRSESEVHGRLIGDRMLRNRYFFNASDNSLVKLFYEQFCSNETLRSKVNLAQVYTTLARNRFPFINHNILASKLMSSVQQLRKSIDEHDLHALKMLTRLVLHDVDNEELYDFLGGLMRQMNADYEALTVSQYKYLALANGYLQTPFCQLNGDLKTKLQRIFADQLTRVYLAGMRPPIKDYRNRRIKSNGYLSNGILLDQWAIYDRSIGDLLTLDQYERYFEGVDRIPLTDQQQLLTFTKFHRLKGDPAYDYQLERILNTLDIQIIETDLGYQRKLLLLKGDSGVPHLSNLLVAKALKQLK